MPTSTAAHHRRVLEELARRGVLLEADACLPSVVSIVAGEPVRGSWWQHPRGQDIFSACRLLYDHDDAVVVKLVSGKTTFVHRELWASLFAVATSDEPWQTSGLSAGAAALLDGVRAAGEVHTDELRAEADDAASVAARVQELEERLLVHSRFLHTDTGHHAKVLRTWDRWREDARRGGGIGGKQRPASAMAIFEVVVSKLNDEFGGDGVLPWQ